MEADAAVLCSAGEHFVTLCLGIARETHILVSGTVFHPEEPLQGIAVLATAFLFC